MFCFRRSLAGLIPCLVMLGCAASAPEEPAGAAPDEPAGAAPEEAVGEAPQAFEIYLGKGSLGASVLGASVLGVSPLQAKGLVSTNSLPPGTLTNDTYRLPLHALHTAALSSAADPARLVSTPLMGTDTGRKLLKYLIHCALPQGKSLKSLHGGIDHEFTGGIGLAPEWKTRPTGIAGDVPAQRWITACLLAHANAFEDEVKILLTGDHPALPATGGTAYFPVQEASFYGNVFGAQPTKPYLHACTGWDAQICWEVAFRDILTRVCGDLRAGCSAFSMLGTCYDHVPGPSPTDACTGFDTPYSTCDTARYDRGAARPAAPARYKEVITVYLDRARFEEAHPSCSDESCGHDVCTTGDALGAGCDTCAAKVCAEDEYCCDTYWDGLCVNEVATFCGPRRACSHATDTIGAPLPATPGSCAAAVCAAEADSYCCDYAWDARCVATAENVCP